MSAKYSDPHANGRFTLAELEAMPGFKRSGDTIRCACPIHGGDNPEGFIVELGTGRGHCFTRGCWGYLDDGTRKPGSARRVAPYGSVPPPIPAPPKETPPDPARKDLLRRSWSTVEAAYPDSPAAAYLASRGISLDVARRGRVGYDPHGDVDPAMRRRVLFPLATIDGVPVNAMGRIITLDDPRRRWDALTGPKGYYHPRGIRIARDERRTLYLCEGTVDALPFLATGVDSVVSICGTGGVVRPQHLRGVWRVVLCFDADEPGQDRGRTMGRLVQGAGCTTLQLTPDELEGAKDVAEYWQAQGCLPPALTEIIAEEQCELDDNLIDEYARRYSAAHIAETLARQYARWENDDRSPQLRKTIADWETFAAARAALGDAVLPQERPTADDGPDDGDTGEWLDLEP